VRCAEEIPLVRRAEKKYEKEKLTVLWVGHQDRISKLNKYAEDHGIQEYLFDPDDVFSRKFGMTYGGGIVFINREGIVKTRIPKGISPATLEAEIKNIL
jgi:hypothetical protein